MSSIGENAYGNNLTVNKLTYVSLDPPIGGFVNNPLTGDLLGGGNSIDLQGGDLTADTLNYTTLNPPINPGVTNPLAAPLLCNGQDIGVGAPADKANEVRAVTLTGDNSAIGVSTGTTLGLSGAVTAGGSTYGAAGNIVNGLTVGTGISATAGNINAVGGNINAQTGLTTNTGDVTATAGNLVAGVGVTAQTGDIVATVGNINATAGSITTGTTITAGGKVTMNDGFFVPVSAPLNAVDNGIQFSNEVYQVGQSEGTVAVPKPVAPPGGAGYQVFTLGAGKFVLDIITDGALGTIPFDINTGLTNVLTDYLIEVTSYCIDAGGLAPVPVLNQTFIYPAIVTPASGNIGIFLVYLSMAGTQKFRTRVKISTPTP